MRLSRRDLLLGSGALAFGIDAAAVEPRWLEVTSKHLLVEGLSTNLEGFSIAHLTDLHLSSLDALHARVVKAVRTQRVNVAVITRDTVEASGSLPQAAELMAELRRAGAEVIVTMGNWEHWGHVTAEDLDRVCTGEKARLLVNTSIAIAGLWLAGTDDWLAGSPRIKDLWEQAPQQRPRVLLTHSPELLDNIPQGVTFDLALAGHTHGGQFRIGPIAPWTPPGSGRFCAGEYETTAGKAYVSRGIGTSIAPIQCMCRPELPIFTLRRA